MFIDYAYCGKQHSYCTTRSCCRNNILPATLCRSVQSPARSTDGALTSNNKEKRVQISATTWCSSQVFLFYRSIRHLRYTGVSRNNRLVGFYLEKLIITKVVKTAFIFLLHYSSSLSLTDPKYASGRIQREYGRGWGWLLISF